MQLFSFRKGKFHWRPEGRANVVRVSFMPRVAMASAVRRLSQKNMVRPSLTPLT